MVFLRISIPQNQHLQTAALPTLDKYRTLQMTKLNRIGDCGNSPKNKMLEDIGIALEMRDCEYLSTILDSEAVWSFSRSIMTTSEQILDTLTAQDKPAAMTVCHALCHGKIGAVNGYAKRGKSEQHFCHIIEFTSTKCNRVKRIDSYGG